MGIRLINYVNNQLQTPALYTNSLAQRPASGIYGRLFMSSDTKEIYQDLTTSWQVIADAGAGSGSLQSVCNNGSTTTTGITIQSNNLALTNATSNFYIKALTVGSILFCDDVSGLVSQDNTNFFWDNTNKRLGIGTASPSSKLDIHSTGINATFNGTGTNNAYLVFQNAGTSKWYVGNLYSGAVANDFVIYDFANSAYRLYIHNTGVVNIPTSLIIGSATPTTSYAFDVTGSGRFSAGLNAGFFNATTATIPANGMYLSAANTLDFSTNTTNRLSIGSTGNVSLGSPSFPNAKLSIQKASSESQPNEQIRMQSTGGAVPSTWRFDVNAASGLFSITDNAVGERLSITSGGNALIGTTTDNGYKFQVSGGVTASGSTAILLTQARDLSTYYGFYANDNSVLYFYNTLAAGVSGQFNRSTGVYTPLSDINKKKDFEISTIGLYEILKLKPTLYRMKEDSNISLKHLGFIAQEVREYIPQSYVEDKNFIGLQDRPIIAALVKAVQELNEKLVRNNIN